MILSTESAEKHGKTLGFGVSVSVGGDSIATVMAPVCGHLFAGMPKRLFWSSFHYHSTEAVYVIQCGKCAEWFRLKPIQVVAAYDIQHG